MEQNSSKWAFWAMVSVAGYIAAQMLADISSTKIAIVAGLAIDAGTFVYPFTFTLRDMVHKAWGKAMARKVVFTAAAINILMALFFSFIIRLEPDPSWPFQEALVSILGPVWRIVIASIVAEVIAELIDTEMYSLWVKKFGLTKQWGRVLSSNAVSVPIDSIIFSLIAFAGLLPMSVVVAIAVSNIIVKFLMTIISIPGIYLTPGERTQQ